MKRFGAVALALLAVAGSAAMRAERQTQVPGLRYVSLGMAADTRVGKAEDLKALPLRVHVYATRERVLSRAGKPVAVEGMGKANLYERGEPRGFDFRFTCPGKVPTSAGYGTYPARWKERGRVLELFVPGGRPGNGMRCEVKVEFKDGAYFRHSEQVEVEPAATFKAWMVKHGYDPEKGKNEPRP